MLSACTVLPQALVVRTGRRPIWGGESDDVTDGCHDHTHENGASPAPETDLMNGYVCRHFLYIKKSQTYSHVDGCV